MGRRPGKLDDFGRFAEPALLIMISLAHEPKHGYAITDDIEKVTGHRPGAGTLYGAMGRLETQGFIKPLVSQGHRCTYKLTAAGAKALRARLDSMEAVMRVGQERLASA